MEVLYLPDFMTDTELRLQDNEWKDLRMSWNISEMCTAPKKNAAVVARPPHDTRRIFFSIFFHRFTPLIFFKNSA